MKRLGLAWRVVAWLLAIGWIPVAAEVSLNYLFRIEERFEPTILIIPYMEFITGPLTCLAALIALYKGAKAVIELLRHREKSS
jgi:hypothetical protein